MDGLPNSLLNAAAPIGASIIIFKGEAILSGFLDRVVPSDYLLLPAATKIAEMFGQLNLKAHAETKLKVRAEYLKRIEEAIQKDLKEGLIPPSK